MPVAAKLSRKLYEAFGEEAAEAMVEWMQSVDTHRTELREINDLAFARIDARFGEAEARSEQRTDELRHAAEMQFAGLRQELHAGLASGREALHAGLASGCEEMHAGLTSVREEMRLGFSHLEVSMERRFTDLMKWATVFWIGSAVTLAGTLIAVARWGG
jgi:hypothetical protein